MNASDQLVTRQRSLHQILGGGFVADVILWRRKDLTVGILAGTLAAWVVFEKSGYTLLSLASSVLFLLFTILFIWAKSATTMNRPPPPLPHLYLSEEKANEVAAILRNQINLLLSLSQDIALARDSRMFVKVALGLLLVAVVGSLADFLTLGYTSLVLVLTIPALYERYEDHIHTFMILGYKKSQHSYMRFHSKCISKLQNWILEKKKLS